MAVKVMCDKTIGEVYVVGYNASVHVMPGSTLYYAACCIVCKDGMWVVQVQKEAIQSVEQDGMVFIDEIDKIVVGSEMRYGNSSSVFGCSAFACGFWCACQHIIDVTLHCLPVSTLCNVCVYCLKHDDVLALCMVL